MKKLAVLPLCLGCLFAAGASHAIDLKQSKVTQVVNDVRIISAADQKQKSATVNDMFNMPDILRTGTASRAELVAADETVTRVGADTIFSFDPASRAIDLKQGSLLFHSPHGKGGGTIHTGSATASVLGTTLIVVTTPNGGMKVIDLEGSVEVNFTNHLKQRLGPGQMTFVLPGGNQLAPVIIFRLDELTANSLLVKGFSQPLASLPLIQNQVDRQVKLIQSGKATDTGLYAGDDASPNQVEVLDINTISHNQPSPPPPPQPPVIPPNPPPVVPTLAAAEAADAEITQPSLTDVSIPTPPVHVFTGTPFGLTGNSFFNGQTFSGFVARNIFVVSTPTVDLSPYRSLVEFDFVAVNNISLESSVIFSGLTSQQNLSLIAGGQVEFNAITVQADVKNFLVSSPQSLSLIGAQLVNNANNITLNSGDAVAFGDISGPDSIPNPSVVSAHGNLIVSAVNDISAVYDPRPGTTSGGPEFNAANAQFTSLTGSILFDSAVLNSSGHAIFTAPTAINLNGSTINSDYVVLNGASSAAITLNNTTINAPTSLTALSSGDLNINGCTLNADASSGTIYLGSTTGSTSISGTAITANNLTVSAATSLNFDGGLPVTPEARSGGPAHYLTLNSGDGILLNARGHALAAGGENPTATFTAGLASGNSINVNNTDFSPFAVVNMAANTINLFNVAFKGTVNLNSLNGLWHNGSVVYGDVNDLGNVTYNGTLVNAPDGSSGLLPGTGITVGTLSGRVAIPSSRGL
jgi:hypothetical protein